MKPKTKWRMQVDYLDSCNCDWGCPCQFNAPPTNGNCEGLGGVHIIEGSYGKIELDSLNLVFVLSYPGAVHEGHGKGSYFIDDRATDDQFDALSKILTGRAGGLFGLYASTLDDFREPQKARVTFESKGIRSMVRAEGFAMAQLEPIRNPVTGKIHRAVIELPGGFEANRMDQASLKKGYINDGFIKYTQSGTYGSFSKTEWKGP